ncbi:OprD family porin [Acinetobacter baumannii]|nr:OprD family outer membrane porin [Acinetobacter baumannii]UWY70614.1 OprD family porin [Acinetobacter baumannii]UWY74992.1 OprD family porin [Acinetobacter baumannii]UWY78996.1 OprD family porin [Acinetobacter baumannii]UWY83502.1 OprD family porin [Acinetobacter baumannii]UWY87749.1 OprD family porin [Acinetobacter baumannii]
MYCLYSYKLKSYNTLDHLPRYLNKPTVDFKAANGEKNHETESNVILNYAFQQPLLKGFALQYIRIDYNVKHGNDFGEDRLFVNYTKKF